MKIAYLITTIERDELLYKSVHSVIDNCTDNCLVLIADQGKITPEKDKWYYELKLKYQDKFHFRQLPYNCGLSFARNSLVALAKEKRCEYCVLMADSILVNEEIQDINYLITHMEKQKYDLIGLELKNRIKWEGWLKLIPKESFEIDFLDPKCKNDNMFLSCNIVRNFFVAKTESLYQTQWDNKMLMGEHEDFFYRYYLKGFKVGCTNMIEAEYIGKSTISPEYQILRRTNMSEGLKHLRQKYDIKNWVTYKNLERIQ